MPFLFKLEVTLLLSRLVATKAMNKVASHINEMQKLHEEYGAVFDQLINEQTAAKKEVKALALGLQGYQWASDTPSGEQDPFCDLLCSGG